jgi:hypothetical protein
MNNHPESSAADAYALLDTVGAGGLFCLTWSSIVPLVVLIGSFQAGRQPLFLN